MAADSSFDIVCKVDAQEVRNAIGNAMKEIQNRFDFKGSKTLVDMSDDTNIELTSTEEIHLKGALDILKTKLVKRGVNLKALEEGNIETALGGTVRQSIQLQNGIPVDKAKEIVKQIKTAKLKVQASIQGDQVRVSGKKKDDLQTVMSMLKEQEFGIAMQFVNYR